MYWKLYIYNHRLRLIAYAVLAIVGALFTSIPSALVYQQGHWSLRYATNAAEAANIWSKGAGATFAIMLVIFTFIAADLGASGVAEHVTPRPLDFLLTRPKERRHFVWTGWLTGMAEIAMLMSFTVLSCAATLYSLSGTLQASQLVIGSLVLLTIAAVVFGISYLTAIAGGSARTGYPLALGITVMYLGLAVLRGTFGQQVFVQRPLFTTVVDWLLRMDEHPGSVAALTISASFAFLLLAQHLFETKEV
jgi:ABC-type transport system involved in multi-copper enzyme maturation permease subunit